jgi:hypothetical protein
MQAHEITVLWGPLLRNLVKLAFHFERTKIKTIFKDKAGKENI